jgi:hypothetical protein
MKSVFCDREPARVGYFQSVLENAGIATFIRNQHTNTTMSEMPSGLFFPVLCVVNDDDFDQAIALILQVRDGTPDGLPEWICEKCRESVPGGFDLCWNCGSERASVVDCER